MPLPDAIRDAPFLQQGLELYLQAFVELSTTRLIGFSEGCIPWTAIKEWGVFHGLDYMQMHDLFYHIRKLDNVYLKHQKKLSDNAKKGKK